MPPSTTSRTPIAFTFGEIDGLVFDVGGVFIYPDPNPVRQWLADHAPDVAELDDDAFRRAHHAGTLAIAEAAAQLAEADAANPEASTSVWQAYDAAYADSLGAPQELGETEGVIRANWGWPHDENIAAFHRIAQLGIPLAIVSNNDGSADQQLLDCGVAQVGDGPLPSVAIVVDSGVIGIAKPDPAIFTPALEALGTTPERTLYVGDTVLADVHGATNAGMPVVQLDPFAHHAHYQHTRLADLQALAEALAESRQT